jgi:ribonuclease P protein component
MLSHRNRFHGHGSLRYLYRHGKSVRGRYFALKYNENERRVHSRFAIVVSKKIYKSAVKRNKIRRRVYEVIRLYKDTFKKPYDVAITILDPQVLLLTHDELRDSLVTLLEKEANLS